MLKNRTIAFKLIFFYTLSGGLIFLLIFTFNYRFSRIMIEKKLEDNARNLVVSKVNRIESVLLAVQKIPDNLASFLESASWRKEELLHLLRTIVVKNPEIYGAAIAFEPSLSEGKTRRFAPYYYKEGWHIRFVDLGAADYQYEKWDWYQIPKELNSPNWSEPYFDEGGGNILMTTYSVPLYGKGDGNKRFLGVLTVDIQLESLQKVVSSIKVLRSGYGFLLSKNGTILTHPDKKLIMNETIFGVAEGRKDKELRELGRRMIHGGSGFVSFKSILYDEPSWMYYTPIPSTGWSLAVLFPKREYTADIASLNRMVLALGVAGLLLLSLAVAFIARSISRPLREMALATNKIATGNLDIELPQATSGDEVGKLAEAFEHMKVSLKEYITQLTETTAAKERIESELKIAHDIQMSILPKMFPPFPDRPEFDLYAVIEPAREVGGDFYDFFFVDEEHFCFVIGDVSGKGIPSSLFMAVTKTLIKATALKGIPPGEILTEVNRELSQDNESAMFVTIFCGIINSRTGELSFANGGHNLPFLIRRDEQAFFLEEKVGLVVGALEKEIYRTNVLQLRPNDSFFMYTDGVTEAMNEKGEFFSDELLEERVNALRGKPIREVIAGIMEAVGSFTQGADQSDDITIMMIHYKGPQNPDGAGS